MATAVRCAARHALQSQGVRSGELAVAFVGKREMRRLHGRWLGEDCVTDVLTFDLQNEHSPRSTRRSRSALFKSTSLSPVLNRPVDGQIIICTAVARDEARRRRLAWTTELLLYVIHGCLHLCGYDDREPRQEKRMRREQSRLLNGLGQWRR